MDKEKEKEKWFHPLIKLEFDHHDHGKIRIGSGSSSRERRIDFGGSRMACSFWHWLVIIFGRFGVWNLFLGWVFVDTRNFFRFQSPSSHALWVGGGGE